MALVREIDLIHVQSVIDEKLRYWLDRRSAHHDPLSQAVMDELNSIRISIFGTSFNEPYSWQ